MELVRSPSNDACANCGAALTGEFCSVCGQKRFVASDRGFGSLLRQFMEAATDLDGRFWGTLRALLAQPGRLSRDYIEGRRARWMSPIALFLLVNLVYFVSAVQSDLATPFEWEVPGRIALESADPGARAAEDAARLRAEPGPLHSVITGPLVDRRIAERDAAARAASNGERGYHYRDYRDAYNAKVPEISKVLTIVHVPLLGVALMLLFRNCRRYFAEHFVVALHLVAFFMAVIVIVDYGRDLLHLFVPAADWHNMLLNWLIRIVLTVYILIALRRAYAVGWAWASAATLGLLASYVVINVYLYRPVLFLTVFALT
jgi:hypothetical protein